MPAPHQHSVPSGGGDAAAPVDFKTSVYQTLIGKGLSPQQAMGVMYSLMGESGQGLSPASYNKNDPGGAMGFAQWVGPRRAGLQETAKAMGLSETDPTAQLAWFNKELDGKYKYVIDNIKKSGGSASDATYIWTRDFEAPAVNNWQARYTEGSRHNALDESGSPKWGAYTSPSATAAAGAPAAAPATSGAQDFSAAANKGDVGGMLAALGKRSGDDGKGESPLSKLSEAVGGKAPAAPQSQQLLSQGGGERQDLAGPSQQLFSQVLAQQAKPLSWSTAPYGAGVAGPQVPGTTLTSAYPYG